MCLVLCWLLRVCPSFGAHGSMVGVVLPGSVRERRLTGTESLRHRLRIKAYPLHNIPLSPGR